MKASELLYDFPKRSSKSIRMRRSRKFEEFWNTFEKCKIVVQEMKIVCYPVTTTSEKNFCEWFSWMSWILLRSCMNENSLLSLKIFNRKSCIESFWVYANRLRLACWHFNCFAIQRHSHESNSYLHYELAIYKGELNKDEAEKCFVMSSDILLRKQCWVDNIVNDLIIRLNETACGKKASIMQ
jgi:hypothetical protein